MPSDNKQKLSSATASRLVLLALGLLLPMTGGCNLRWLLGWDMYIQPKPGKTYRESDFFADQTSARPLVAGTVPRSEVFVDRSSVGVDYKMVNYAGDGFPSEGLTDDNAPLEGDALQKVLDRGQTVFNIYCAVCHGRTGMADGMIVRRGFTQPPSFVIPSDPAERDKMSKADPHRWQRTEYLQTVAPRHFYNAITQGFGAMYSYGERVKPVDRWKVAIYIKHLQTNPAKLSEPTTKPAAEHPAGHE